MNESQQLQPWHSLEEANMLAGVHLVRQLSMSPQLCRCCLSGTRFEGVAFRPAIMELIIEVGEYLFYQNSGYRLRKLPPDGAARRLLPSLPPLKPNTRMLTHLRTLLIFIPVGSNCLKIFDAIVQVARYSEQDMTEAEFAAGVMAANELRAMYVNPCLVFVLPFHSTS